MSSFATPGAAEDEDGSGTPRLSSVLDSFAARIIDPVILSWGRLSINDGAGMDPSVFSAHGEQIVKVCRQLAFESTIQGSASSSRPTPLAGPLIDSPIFKPKKWRPKPFEPSAGDGSSTAKQAEKEAQRGAAEKLLFLMDDECREKFLPGLRDIPQSAVKELLLKSICNTAGEGSLANCYNGLVRFREWMRQYFSSSVGLKASPAVTAWFLHSNMVPDEDGGHVSQSLFDALVFAGNRLKMGVQVCESVRALSKAPTKTPKQAPSASVRAAYHFWHVAEDADHGMPVRAIAAVFFVMCMAALRGIDSQRSSFDDVFGEPGHQWRYFTGVAYNSKSRQSMPWACVVRAFHGKTGWFEALRFAWGDRDYMFPSIARGKSLGEVSEFIFKPASSYMILKYLRFILQLPSVSLPAAEAARMRRHSFRHWVANCIRILKFPMSDAFQGGRWKEMAVMPLRYAQETRFVSSVDVIRRVLDACERAMEQTPIDEWPVFGGWELLLPLSDSRRTSAGDIPLTFEPEPGVDDGSDDSSDDEDLEEQISSPAKPKRAAARKPKNLPPAWTMEKQVLSSGREVPHYHGPNGEYARSVVEAWRKSTPSGDEREKSACERVLVGQRINVHWTEDDVWYVARVRAVSTGDPNVVECEYVDDQEVHWHDLSREKWEFESTPQEVPEVTKVHEETRTEPAQVEVTVEASSETVAKTPLWLAQTLNAYPDGSPSSFVPVEAGSKRSRSSLRS
jgi:hypothetical protein